VAVYIDDPIPSMRYLTYRLERRAFRLAFNHSTYLGGKGAFTIRTWYKNALVIQRIEQKKKAFILFDIFKGTFTGKLLFPGYMYDEHYHDVFRFSMHNMLCDCIYRGQVTNGCDVVQYFCNKT
jgi:hypothetical protein